MDIIFSADRHLRCVLKINGKPYYLLRSFFDRISLKRIGLELDTLCEEMFLLAKDSEWTEYYLPPFSLEGMTVLDIGAGCGETAWFFLRHGAEKVIAIEKDVDRCKLMTRNKNRLGLNIEIIPREFNMCDLNRHHDFIKCDIEGYEMEMLPVATNLKPCIMECHNRWVMEQFLRKGFRPLGDYKNNVMLNGGFMCNW